MIATIATVSLRALLSRRRALLMALLAAVPVAVGLLARFRGLPGDPVERTAATIDLLEIRTVLPLVALVFGTAALGAELEDGTAIHLLTKPVARWRIVAGKLLAAGPLTALLTVGGTLLTGLVIGGERGTLSVTVALSIAVLVGSLVYVVVFVALSVVTNRALVIGLVYTVIWEGVLAGLFEGTRALSIRQYTIAIAAAIDPASKSGSVAALAVTTALPLAIIVLVGGFVIASRRLAVHQIAAGD
ncbi:MAG TPA: ABC transporter permease [Candidatus Dormibacteraeota bacterium]|nr:ABC transporter permease [Candidatus Dormibacteraeota bacterium]